MLDRIEAEFRAIEGLSRRGLPAKTRLLFVGPPGCGKTLCAEVLAADLGLPVLYARFDSAASALNVLASPSTSRQRVASKDTAGPRGRWTPKPSRWSL